MHDPNTDFAINASAQLSILEACRLHNTDIKLVFASTRQLYGKPDYLPVDERHPIRPVDVNGINKLAWTFGGIVAFLTLIQLITGKGALDFIK